MTGILCNTGWTRLRRGYGGQADEPLGNTGWTDEARPPSLGNYGETPGAAANGTAWSGGLVANTGWTDEARAASLAVRQAKAKARERNAEREEMFGEQAKRAGEYFVENWYPRGRDGKNQDPHFGRTSREAPYGYVDGTDKPRKEPLYDRYGRPIVPRSRDDFRKPEKSGFWPFEKDYSLERDLYWLGKLKRAEQVWGRFGEKKKFMDANPGASEADWKKHDRERFEEWKAGRE